MKATFELSGFKELESALGELIKTTSSATGKGVLRRALISAAQPMADRARELAPKGETGSLRQSIIVSARSTRRVGREEYHSVMRDGGSRAEALQALIQARRENKGVGPSLEVYVGPAGAKWTRRAHLIEFGTAPGVRKTKTGKTINHPGTAPNAFMRPAFVEQAQPTLDRLKVSLRLEIAKAAQRAARRAARVPRR